MDVNERLAYLERKVIEHDFQLDTYSKYIDRLVAKLLKHEEEIVTLTELKKAIRKLCYDLEEGISSMDAKLERFNTYE